MTNSAPIGTVATIAFLCRVCCIPCGLTDAHTFDPRVGVNLIPVNREQQFGVHQLAADTVKRPHPWHNPEEDIAQISISPPCLINYVCPRDHQLNCSLITSKRAVRCGSVCENHDWELITSGKDSHGTVGDTYDLVVDTIRCHRYIHIDPPHRLVYCGCFLYARIKQPTFFYLPRWHAWSL